MLWSLLLGHCVPCGTDGSLPLGGKGPVAETGSLWLETPPWPLSASSRCRWGGWRRVPSQVCRKHFLLLQGHGERCRPRLAWFSRCRPSSIPLWATNKISSMCSVLQKAARAVSFCFQLCKNPLSKELGRALFCAHKGRILIHGDKVQHSR